MYSRHENTTDLAPPFLPDGSGSLEFCEIPMMFGGDGQMIFNLFYAKDAAVSQRSVVFVFKWC